MGLLTPWLVSAPTQQVKKDSMQCENAIFFWTADLYFSVNISVYHKISQQTWQYFKQAVIFDYIVQ